MMWYIIYTYVVDYNNNNLVLLPAPKSGSLATVKSCQTWRILWAYIVWAYTWLSQTAAWFCSSERAWKSGETQEILQNVGFLH